MTEHQDFRRLTIFKSLGKRYLIYLDRVTYLCTLMRERDKYDWVCKFITENDCKYVDRETVTELLKLLIFADSGILDEFVSVPEEAE